MDALKALDTAAPGVESPTRPQHGETIELMTTPRYLLERVDDAAVVQLYADGFAQLSLRDKILAWHLYLAALAGRDIYYDQRYALNLEMRALLEAIADASERRSMPTVLHEDPALHEAVLDQQRPLQQPHRAKVRPAPDTRELLDAARAAAQKRSDALVADRASRSSG